jgi:hypothetical protein
MKLGAVGINTILLLQITEPAAPMVVKGLVDWALHRAVRVLRQQTGKAAQC